MKKLIFTILACVAFFAISCSDDVESSNLIGEISLSSSEISVGPEAKTVEVTVTSSGDWKISGTYDWVTPSVISGKNGEKVTFSIKSNDGKLREAVYKFFVGSTIREYKISSNPSYFINLESESLDSIDNTSQDIRIKFNTNIDSLTYMLTEGSDSWLKYQETPNVLNGGYIALYRVLENTDYEPRASTITILGKQDTINVEVFQKQLNAILIQEGKIRQQYNLDARDIAIEIKANVNYTIENTYDWITVVNNPIDRGHDDLGLTEQTINLQLSAAPSSRAGKITLKSSDYEDMYIYIQQIDPDAEYVEFSDNNLTTALGDLGYILKLGDNSGILLTTGKDATELDVSNKSISDLSGLDIFEKLTKLNVSRNNIKSVNLSAWSTITDLNIDMNPLEVVNLGDNAVRTLTFSKYYGFMYGSELCVFVSSKLEEISMSDCGYYLDVADLSECPQLTKINLGTLSWGAVEKLILSESQEGNIEITKSNSTIVEYK